MMASAGNFTRGCPCDRCRMRGLMGPAVLVTLGALFLLDNWSRISFHRTWPLILVVIGVIKVLQSNASTARHRDLGPPAIIGAAPPAAGSQSSLPASGSLPGSSGYENPQSGTGQVDHE